MRTGGKAPKPTKAQLVRWGRLTTLGCIACFLWDGRFREPQIHHLNLGGRAGQKRRGHDYTIPLCEWHHQGYPDRGKTSVDMAEKYGPSLAKQSKKFRERFGTDDYLLQAVNVLIEEGVVNP